MHRKRSSGNRGPRPLLASGMWVGESEGTYEYGGGTVGRSVGGYLEENPDFGGGYGQDDDPYDEMAQMGSRRGNQMRMMGGQQGMIGGQQGMMGGQQGMMGGQQGMMGGQRSMKGNRKGMMGGQRNMMGSEQSMMGGQQSMMGNRSGMMGGQHRMMGSQGGMMGGQGGMMGDQGGMMGNQMGMMGNQMGMMGQGRMMGGQQSEGNQNSELVQLLKKQSEVISKLTERIGLDTTDDYDDEDDGYGYGQGYDEEEYYEEDYYEEDYGPYGPMRGGPRRGPRGGPYGGGMRRPMRGGPGGPMRGPMRGGPGGPMRGPMRRGPSQDDYMGGFQGFGGMPMRGSPGKRRGDFQRDFGGKRPRVDNEGRIKKARSGYAVKTAEQKEREKQQHRDHDKEVTAFSKMPKTTTKQTATQEDKPWMTAELKSLLDAKNLLAIKFKQSNTTEVYEEYRKYRNTFIARSRLAKKLYFQDLEVEQGRFPQYEEGKVIGKKYIEKVQGYYCELCRRFFREKEEGTIEHCMTWAHYQRLKNEKFPKEEKEEDNEKGDGEDEKGDGEDGKEEEQKKDEKKGDEDNDKSMEEGDDPDVRIEETETTMEEEDELLKEED